MTMKMSTMLKRVINNDALYDIVSAMRGPDNVRGSIKYVFTARIRVLAGLESNQLTRRDEKYITEQYINVCIIDGIGLPDHYYTHIYDALQALRVMGLIELDEYQFLRELVYEFIGSVDDDISRDRIRAVFNQYRYVWDRDYKSGQ